MNLKERGKEEKERNQGVRIIEKENEVSQEHAIKGFGGTCSRMKKEGRKRVSENNEQ